MKKPIRYIIAEYAIITLATLLLSVGIYFFRFPNHFTFGGITGLSVILSSFIPLSPTLLNNCMNVVLLVVGFCFLGKGFGVKTFYVTVLSILFTALAERFFPMSAPFTREPVLELIFAIALPALAAAILFNLDASSGGTDIIAMILRKYISLDIGVALMCVDTLIALSSFFIFGIEAGLYSVTGLLAKTLLIDNTIENINLCKFFTIVTDNPKPIVAFIHNELHRSATIQHAEGTYTHIDKSIILVVTKRRQAIELRNFIRKTEPNAFMMITNSSEIIGKGFRGFN